MRGDKSEWSSYREEIRGEGRLERNNGEEELGRSDNGEEERAISWQMQPISHLPVPLLPPLSTFISRNWMTYWRVGIWGYVYVGTKNAHSISVIFRD